MPQRGEQGRLRNGEGARAVTLSDDRSCLQRRARRTKAIVSKTLQILVEERSLTCTSTMSFAAASGSVRLAMRCARTPMTTSGARLSMRDAAGKEMERKSTRVVAMVSQRVDWRYW